MEKYEKYSNKEKTKLREILKRHKEEYENLCHITRMIMMATYINSMVVIYDDDNDDGCHWDNDDIDDNVAY